MAATRDQIEAAFRAEFPTLSRQEADGDVVDLSPEEYEATILLWVDHEVERQAMAEAEDARRDLRTQVRNYLQTLAADEAALVNGIATLKGPTPPTTIAQLRPYVTNLAEMTLSHNRGLQRLITVLIDRGIVELDES